MANEREITFDGPRLRHAQADSVHRCQAVALTKPLEVDGGSGQSGVVRQSE